MGDAYFATEPTCPTHGRMKWIHPSHSIGGGWKVYTASYWICHGFDGEGCDHVVHERDMNWMEVSSETITWNRAHEPEPGNADR